MSKLVLTPLSSFRQEFGSMNTLQILYSVFIENIPSSGRLRALLGSRELEGGSGGREVSSSEDAWGTSA